MKLAASVEVAGSSEVGFSDTGAVAGAAGSSIERLRLGSQLIRQSNALQRVRLRPIGHAAYANAYRFCDDKAGILRKAVLPPKLAVRLPPLRQ